MILNQLLNAKLLTPTLSVTVSICEKVCMRVRLTNILRLSVVCSGMALTGCAAVDVTPKLILQSGKVLFDVGPVKIDPLKVNNKDCRRGRTASLPDPFQEIGAPNQYGSDARGRALSYAVMTRAAAWVGAQDVEAAHEAIEVLDHWARSQALTVLHETTDGRNTKSIYALKVVLMGVIPSWAALAPFAQESAPDKKRRIDHWLDHLVQKANVPTGGRASRSRTFDCANNGGLPHSPVSNCNNHRYLRDAVAMAWGAYTDNDVLFHQGLARYGVALQQMRPDGSLPLETMRGARALWYQRHALASLSVMAEMAAVQGHNLYGRQYKGRSLATGIDFLTQALRDESQVQPYAQTNAIPGPNMDWQQQDKGFLRERAMRHYMAWTQFASTDPDVSKAATTLTPLIVVDGAMIDEYSGGNISCYKALKNNI